MSTTAQTVTEQTGTRATAGPMKVDRMRVLVAYDGSECADVALHDLANASLPAGTQVVVLSVADVFLQPPGAAGAVEWTALEQLPEVRRARELAKEALSKAREAADGAARRLRELHPAWNVRTEAYAESPVRAIVREAERFNSDLIVVGSHGRSALSRLVLGSVSQGVLHHAPCSVRVARRGKRLAAASAGPVAGGPVRILVGLDGSPDAAAAVRAVAGRPWPAGSEARLVTALDLRTETAVWPLGQAAVTVPTLGDGRAWVRQATDDAVRELRDAGLPVTHEAVAGDPKRVLVEEADRWGADCVFVGAQGLTAVERFLLGSVSSAVAARAHCTVEVVRSR